MAAHKPLHLFEAKSADTRISRDDPRVARVDFLLANGASLVVEVPRYGWNVSWCEQSEPSKQRRFSPEGLQ
jgi:hypothetical protein